MIKMILNSEDSEIKDIDKIYMCEVYFHVFCYISEGLDVEIDFKKITECSDVFFDFLYKKLIIDFCSKYIKSKISICDCNKKIEESAKRYFKNVNPLRDSSYYYLDNLDISKQKYH